MISTTIANNNTARLLAIHRCFRSGNVARACRIADKIGIGANTPDRLWEIVVSRLTGSVYGYATADVAAALPNQVKQAPSANNNILPRY